MSIDGAEIKRGDNLFYPSTPTDVKKRYKPGIVLDTNEHIKAVKVQFVVSIKHNRVRSEWFPVAILLRSLPQEAKPCQ